MVFDIDGTLIESMAVDTELYFASIKSVLGPVNIRENLSEYDNVTDSGILAQIIDDNGILPDDGLVGSIQDLFVKRIRNRIQSVGPFRAVDGAVQVIQEVRHTDDSRVAIATGGWRESAMLKLDTAGFNLDGIPVVSSDDSPSRVEIMQIALSRLGSDFESVTYFGDAEWDRRACQQLGWNFVAVGSDLSGIESFENILP